MRLFLAASLIAFALPAHAYQVYDSSCATPSAPAHVWYVDPVNGSTPDAVHGGLAVGGVMGTADGSQAHPFNSLAGVFHGGKYENPVTPGYSHPILSTAPYDHYPKTGVNGQRRDYDWNPVSPDPTRINPGDQIVLESGSYGDLGIGYSGVKTANVDVNGNTAFVSISADTGATPVFNTLNVSGARGFVVEGVTVKSDVSQGAKGNSHIVNIGGSAVTPTLDIIFDNDTVESWASLAEAQTAWDTEDPAHTLYTSLPTFMRGRMRYAMTANGDDQPGAHNACIAVENSTVRFTYTALSAFNSGKVLFTHNDLGWFGNDGVDYGSSNIMMIYNLIHDALNLLDGTHPDGHQSQISATFPGPFANVVIDHERVLERTDPTNPYPQNLTFAQFTGQLTGATITNNIGETSNCPGLAFGGSGSLIANNTMVWNGAAVPGSGCPEPKSGELAQSSGNLWENNAVAGAFYQACNSSVWKNNVQIPGRSAGKSIPATSSYCLSGKTTYTSTAGSYNGITIYTTDSPSFAFRHYDPPSTGVTSATDPNLTPTAGGPLYQTGTPINTPPPPPPPNVGAY